MELSYVGPCVYRDGLGRLCRCNLHVYRDGDDAVVVASEREDNPGASVTNAFEHMATKVWQTFGLSLGHTIWLEHYSTQSYRVRIDETFAWVSFDLDGARLASPRWQPASREALEQHIGQPFEAASS